MRKQEAVFEACVEFQGEQRKIMSSENKAIEDVVVRTLLHDLPLDLQSLYGLEVQVRVTGVRYHSLSVFFAVAMGTYSVLSGYKGLFESVDLIREHANKLLDAALRHHGDFNVSVYRRYPSDQWFDPEFYFMRKHRPFRWPFHRPTFEPSSSSRDGFFWFLFWLCLVQFLIIGLLVYRAVLATYFG